MFHSAVSCVKTHMQSRAVVEVREPQHKHKRMIDGPDFYKRACPSRVQHFVSPGNTSIVGLQHVCVLGCFVCLCFLKLQFVELSQLPYFSPTLWVALVLTHK